MFRRIVGLAFLAAPAIAAATLPNYAILEIPPLGGSASVALGLNDFNEVVGWAQRGDMTTAGLYYNPDTGSQEALGLPGNSFTQYYAINDYGRMVGRSHVNSYDRPVMFKLGHTPVQMLPAPDGGYANAVDSTIPEQAVGEYEALDNTNHLHATVVRWRYGGRTTLFYGDAIPGAINNGELVACSSLFHYGQGTSGQLFFLNAANQRTNPTIPSNYVWETPTGLSDWGPHCCGYASVTNPFGSGNMNKAFVYYQNDTFQLLDGPFGSTQQTEANAIVVWGDVTVGRTDISSTDSKATVWELSPGQTPSYKATDLNTLLPANSNWDLQEATGVGAFYAICGWGYRMENGLKVKRGFIMLPTYVDQITFDPNTVVGGNSINGKVALSKPAPVDCQIQLSSNNAAATVPAYVTVKANSNTALVPITTKAVAANTPVTISTSFANTSASGHITVLKADLSSVTTSVSSVVGGNTLIAWVWLTGLAANATPVGLTSSNACLQVPATMTIPINKRDVSFTVNTTAVSVNTNATITAKLGSKTVTTTVTVTP